MRNAPMAPQGRAEELTYGLRACLAVLETRPAEVSMVAFATTVRRELEGALRLAAARRLPCREVGERELVSMSGTKNHEGVCVLAAPRRWVKPSDLAETMMRERSVALALDRVRNPYNVGAILRTAAFFGVRSALFGAQARDPAIAVDAIRVAEGGVEHLRLCRTTDLAETLGRLRAARVQVIGADGGGSTPALGYGFARPTVVVMGNEREGMSERVRAQCDAIVSIRGTGAVESLNVAVAAGVLIAEATRGPTSQHS
jgi:TrmH RNA methyltransferase